MRKCLLLIGTGLLFHAVLAVGCAEGNEDENVFIPEPSDAATGKDSSAGGSAGDASTEAGKEGGAGTSGAAGTGGAAGSSGTGGVAGTSSGGASGSSGSSGASGTGGSSTGGSSTGGSSTGGSSTGGSSTGGSGTGGSSTGGSSTGGSSTGGSSTGGSSTGGSSTGGSSTGGSSTGGTGGSSVYSHTINIGSGNDFNADEDFASTSSGFTGYVTWDSTHIYVGMEGSDIGSSLPNRFLLVYIGIPLTPGSTTGFKYNTQQPTLPFEARFLIALKTDGSYQEAREYTGGAWNSKAWDFAQHYSKSGSFFEVAIERQTLGYPAKVMLHMNMINETNSSEGTFAGVPTGSFTDGYDPDFSKYFEFDLTGTNAPGQYLPKP